MQIEGEAVALAFDSPVVSRVGEQAYLEQRKSLHLLVACGKGAIAEEVVAGLLDHVLQVDEGCLIVIKLVASLDGFVIVLRFLPAGRWPLGTNEAIREDGLDRHPLKTMCELRSNTSYNDIFLR